MSTDYTRTADSLQVGEQINCHDRYDRIVVERIERAGGQTIVTGTMVNAKSKHQQTYDDSDPVTIHTDD